jgi:hypothetical protein
MKTRLVANLLTWAGSGLVFVSAVLHFHLWASDGYDKIPTIGPLFLMQAIVGWVLSAATSALRHWALVLVEAGFALSTVGGLLISVNVGLFGWQDTMSSPFAWLTLGLELGAAALLLCAGVILLRPWLVKKLRP